MPREPREFPVQVAILAFDGCMTSAVTGLVDALQIANFWALQTQTATVEVFSASVFAANATTVRGSGGFAIPTTPLAAATRPDIAIVPPIMAPLQETLAANPAIVAWLRDARETVLASVCAGAFFLAEAGLLSGRRATTNPIFADAFRRSYADVELVPEARLIDQGRVLCAGSTTAFLDLAIYLVDRFVGHEVALLTAKSLSVDKNHQSQLPYFLYVAPKDHGDAAVLDVQTWMEEQHARALSVDQLAQRASMSQRSFNRRFRSATGMSPLDYLHRLRIESAKRLLERSDLSVDQITTQVGYEDQRSFSRLFASIAGLSPRDYRSRFGARLDALEPRRVD